MARNGTLEAWRGLKGLRCRVLGGEGSLGCRVEVLGFALR